MRIHLRDLFWVIAMLALACGWYVDHRAQATAHEKARANWHKTISGFLRSWRTLQAENEALKVAAKPQVTEP